MQIHDDGLLALRARFVIVSVGRAGTSMRSGSPIDAVFANADRGNSAKIAAATSAKKTTRFIGAPDHNPSGRGATPAVPCPQGRPEPVRAEESFAPSCRPMRSASSSVPGQGLGGLLALRRLLGRDDERAEAEALSLSLREGGERRLAVRAERLEHAALGVHAPRRVLVGERGETRCLVSASAMRDSMPSAPLPDRGARPRARKHLGGPRLEPEPHEAGAREDDRVELARVDLAEARVDVAADREDPRSGRRRAGRPRGEATRCRPSRLAAGRRACRTSATRGRRADPRGAGCR